MARSHRKGKNSIIVEENATWSDRFFDVLQKRALLIFAVMAFFGMLVVLLMLNRSSTIIAESLALQQAEFYSQAMTRFRAFYASEIVARVADSRDVTVTHDYKATPLAIPIPPTMSLEMSEQLSDQIDARIYSDFPFPWRIQEGGIRDNFEQEALSFFRDSGDGNYFRFTYLSGEMVLRFAEPVILSKECVSCHNTHPQSPKKDWKAGDVRGVQEVFVPLEQESAGIRNLVMDSFSIMSVLGLFGLGFLAIVLSGLRRSVKKSKRLANQLQEKNEELEMALSQLQDAQAKLIIQEKMAHLGEVTAGIAHEIQNPLNFVNNFAEFSKEILDELKEELTTLKTQHDGVNQGGLAGIVDDLSTNVSKISEHGKRADGIVKGMLLHSRGVADDFAEMDINTLVRQFVQHAYHGMKAQDESLEVEIEESYQDDVGTVVIAQQDFGRAFLNIMNNALYAVHEKKTRATSPYEPSVQVKTMISGNSVEIRLKDNGDGIPEEIIEKIFQPFFTTKPTGQGTGLGLSICYDIIVQQHGGDIEVNTLPGEGTEFIISLPMK